MQAKSCNSNGDSFRYSTETRPDRLSVLPDPLLLRILSLLPMNEAIQNTFHSKQWEHLRNSIFNLTFSYHGSRKAEFVDFVNKTITRYGNDHHDSKTKKFSVSLDFESHKFFCYEDLHSWVRFAIKHNMEDLAFEWNFSSDSVDYCKLPKDIYAMESLRSLSLRMCDIQFHHRFIIVNWKSLKRLTIGFSVLRAVAVRSMLQGSLVLEYLELCHCGSEDNNLFIASPSLKVLVIRDFRYLSTCQNHIPYSKTYDHLILEICGPCLSSMEILGTWYRKCRVISAPSLVYATLDFDRRFYCPDLEDIMYAKCRELAELLQRLCHVENLTIGASCLETLGAAAWQGLSCSASKRRCLTLNVYIRNWHLPGVASILASSPNLETLTLRTTSPYANENAGLLAQNKAFSEKMYSSQLENRNILLPNLKIVNFSGYRTAADDSLLTLLEFLQKNARLLGKNLIDLQGGIIRLISSS